MHIPGTETIVWLRPRERKADWVEVGYRGRGGRRIPVIMLTLKIFNKTIKYISGIKLPKGLEIPTMCNSTASNLFLLKTKVSYYLNHRLH